MLKFIALVALSLVGVNQASASSEDAWVEFRNEVEQGCIAATKDLLDTPEAVVDPFGSESYGLAVVTGNLDGGTAASIICVFDKQTKAIEISGELENIVAPAQ